MTSALRALLNVALIVCGLVSHAAAQQNKPIVDCAGCPEMVTVPAGSFVMGMEHAEKMRSEDGRYMGPPRPVTIRPFAIGRTEVTNEQFAAFVAENPNVDAVKCYGWGGENAKWGLSWDNPGLGQPIKPNEPVVCTSWRDAKAYAAWLSKKTGKKYRLPTEAEWEYAALGGAANQLPAGEAIARMCEYANILDKSAASNPQLIEGSGTSLDMAASCDDGFPLVAPVAQFKPNAYGLYDMIGNVWEWAEDCSFIPYPAQPTDGSAVAAVGPCDRRASRGGAWRTRANRQYAAFRGMDPEDTTYHIFGFRVARDID